MNRPLRIGLDLTLLQPHRVTGLERYARNLALVLLSSEAEDLEWVLFFRYGVPLAFERFRSRATMLVSPFYNRPLTDQWWLPAVARRARLDLMHFPAYPAPPAYRGRFVLTVHDAALWRFPALVSPGARHYYRRLFPQALERAERILTVSEFSKNELISILGLPESRVVAVPEGIDRAFLEPLAVRPARTEPYVLTVSTIEPRKNLARLIEAMDRLPERHAGVELQIVGRQGWQDRSSLPPSRATIRWHGSVDDHRLRELYRSAAVFAFPSLYEGFGLPLLEAMAQGVPCVASTAGSLPEIGENACLYASPTSAEEWAEKLTRLLDDSSLREDLSARGLKRSAAFRWETTARQTIEVYRAAARIPNQVSILGTTIDCTTLEGAEASIAGLVEAGEGGLVLTPNVDHLLTLRGDPDFQEIYRHASLVLADGMPLIWASWLLGRKLPERVAGADLLPRLCELASRRGFRVFFLGGQPETLSASLATVQEMFPQLQISGGYAPPFGFEHDSTEDRRTVQAVLDAKPDLLFVCLGAPKQEKFIWRHRAQLGGIVSMGAGISFDFMTGRRRRAPIWMQRAGLEWVHRLKQEPRRLFRRYLRDTKFPLLVVGQFLQEGRQTPKPGAPEASVPTPTKWRHPAATDGTRPGEPQRSW